MLNSMFHRFWVAFRTEMRLLIINRLYPLLHVLWGGLFFRLFVGQDDRSAQALLETTVGRLAIGLVSLIGLFMAGISISRSKRVRFLELEETYPIGFEVIAGRWAAGFAAVLLFMVEPLMIAAGQGPFASWVEALPVFLLEAGLTIAFVTALAWALLVRQNIDRWAYLILAAVWLAFLLGPGMLAGRFPSASLLNFMRQGVSFYSDVWGRLIYGAQPLWFNLFYLGLLLFCLAVMMLTVTARRSHTLSKSAAFLLVGALSLAGWGGTRYIGGIQAANVQPQSDSSLNDPAQFRVTDYSLVMDLADPSYPRFRAALEVLNPENQPLDRLIFRLNPQFSITPSNVEVKREGNLIFMTLPQPLNAGERQSVTLNYEGRLRVESVSGGVVEATDFIDPRGLRLTPAVAWYPLPAFTAQPAGLHEPARFVLQIVNPPDWPIAANLPAIGENLFAAEHVGWVFLVASPRLVVEQIDEVRLITARSDLEKRARVCRRLFPRISFHCPLLSGCQCAGTYSNGSGRRKWFTGLYAAGYRLPRGGNPALCQEVS